jgi:glycosyltransferase involved in cell wall biosynthesis
MRLGIALSQVDSWNFFEDVFEDLKSHYQVKVFQFPLLRTPFFYERINTLRFQLKMKAFLRSQDVILFEWASGLLAAATQYEKDCSIVTRLHRYELYEWADKIKWEHVDKIILVSRAMRRKFSKKFPEHDHKTIVLPVGVSTKKFQPNGKKFNGDIGIMCNLIPRKRVYDLILTCHELLRSGENLHLHIAGGYDPLYADYFDALQNLVHRLDLRDHVTFYGKIADSWKWYRSIDIFVSNSYSEGMQVSPMEAMASGCYCLSHHWDGAEELLPYENLFFTNTELIEKILRYYELSEGEKRDRRASMRAIILDRFDIEQVKCQMRSILENSSSQI